MPFLVRHLFANVRKTSDFRPDVTAIVLFGLEATDGNPVYLEIRFLNYDALEIEGDHLMLSLEEAMDSAETEFGILQSDWRPMTESEIQRIPFFVGGKRV